MAGLVGIKGTLTGTTPLQITVAQGWAPFTIQASSTQAAPALGASADGTNFVTVPPTYTSGDNVMAVVQGPLAAVKITGHAGDEWSIM